MTDTNDRSLSRRDAVTLLAGSAVAMAAGHRERPTPEVMLPPLSGRLKQSVCQWCYAAMPLDDLCRNARDMGLKSVELLGEKDWPTVTKYGLICAMANGPCTIEVGFNRPSEHDRLVREGERLIPLIADLGYPNMIVFSGNRKGMSDGEGIDNCAKGLARLMPTAEKYGVTVQMELLNSKVDHHDYQCDHTPWGVELAKKVDSARFKLLYDIYHMQIMEGDVIRTIRDNAAYIGHFHTGGVPGRNEIDETQELNYRRIMQAVVDLGFQGYVAQEFIPKRDPMVSLRQGKEICDV
jgi:hydroxypyruvate isomerase